MIEGNIYDNCKGACVMWGLKAKTEHGRAPDDNKFKKNILIADELDSEFLKFVNTGTDNEFKDNEMWGSRASRGGLHQDAVRRLDERPNIPIPDTPCKHHPKAV
jgi:hypothetical protein